MIDDPDDQEQGRLEEGMTEQQRQPRQRGILCAVPEHDHEETELTDSPVREEALEVCLAQGLPSAQEHREAAEADHDRVPRGVLGEHRRQHRNEVDARLDHRRCVQVRRDRSGRCHRTRKPEVEREDRRLAERSDQQQHERGCRDGTDGWVGEDLGQARGSRLHHDQDDTDEHDKTTKGCHQERLQRRPPACRTPVVVADKQVRQNARDLPEHHEHDDIVGENESVHRPREREQYGGELAEVLFAIEVPPAIQQHEGADSGDDQREHPREGVHPHRQRDVEGPDPGERLERDVRSEHSGRERRGVDESPERDGGGEEERSRPPRPHEHRQGE